MDNRFKGKIKTALRRLSWSWAPYKQAKEKAKTAPMTFQCNKCGYHTYTGTSEKSFEALKKRFKKVQKEKVCVDHIKPVEDTEKGWQGWDVFIESLYCDISNLQVLCKICHDKKSKEENQFRREKKNGSN